MFDGIVRYIFDIFCPKNFFGFGVRMAYNKVSMGGYPNAQFGDSENIHKEEIWKSLTT